MRCRRLLADQVDTIHVEVWTSIIPAGTFTPQTVWAPIAQPDARMWEVTRKWGVPMNLTFLNATTYYVRTIYAQTLTPQNPHACLT